MACCFDDVDGPYLSYLSVVAQLQKRINSYFVLQSAGVLYNINITTKVISKFIFS